jgi:hypothetical protein
VKTRETWPDDVLLSSSRSYCRTLISAAAYENVLERIGGRRVEVRSSVRSSELLVALYESPPYDLKVAPMDVARLSRT